MKTMQIKKKTLLYFPLKNKKRMILQKKLKTISIEKTKPLEADDYENKEKMLNIKILSILIGWNVSTYT